jgi:hypothetical protein
MTGRSALFGLGLAALAATFLVASPSHAQCRLCGTPKTAPESAVAKDLIDLEIEAALDFDRLVVLGPGEGSATLRPDGLRQVSGTVGSLSARAMVGEARVRGEPGRAIRIDLPRRIALHSLSGGQISIEDIVTDLPDMPRLDSAGRLSFRFGGRVRVTGDAEGDYRGDLPITADYL